MYNIGKMAVLYLIIQKIKIANIKKIICKFKMLCVVCVVILS